MTIRSRLFAVVLALLVPAFCASGIAVWYVYTEERKVQEEALAEASQAFAALVHQELRTYEATLLSLATSPAIQTNDLQAAYEHAKRRVPMGSAIVLSDLDGKQIFNTRVRFGTDINIKRSQQMQVLLDRYGDAQTIITDLFSARTVKSWDIGVQLPVRVDGKTEKFLGMALSANRIQSVLESRRFPATWLVTIVDRRGAVIARSSGADKFVGTVIRPYSQRIIAASTEGKYPSVTLDGVDVTAFFSRVPQADWTVLLSVSNDELARVPQSAALILGLSMMILILLGAFIAGRMARRAIKAVTELETLAQGLHAGRAPAYRKHGIKEFDAVGCALAEAARTIASSQQHLREEVAQAIAETERVQRASLQGQKLEALGRLSAGITHEFNNLLQTMLAVTELMHLTSDVGKLKLLATRCRRAVEKGVALTRQLKTFGRVQETEAEVISLIEQIPASVELIRDLLPGNISLIVDVAADCPLVRVDPLQLELAILNIAINARDAMIAGGVIGIMAHPAVYGLPADLTPGEFVVVTIEDNGHGMDAETLAVALEPFFTTKPVGTGTGLGLAQAYGLAKQSGGTLEIASIVGQGTTVTMYFPAATFISTDVIVEALGHCAPDSALSNAPARSQNPSPIE